MRTQRGWVQWHYEGMMYIEWSRSDLRQDNCNPEGIRAVNQKGDRMSTFY